ncbi:hypothetical protein M885DRAFT_530977 [Pelagophyceae sp. CCMP2097]|nr:hypothetical protein M885DRAFT_530977 [Pelagophyceae sp. CCMP2097]
MLAAQRGRGNLLEALAAHGADLDAEDGARRTARALALAHGFDALAARLVELGARPVVARPRAAFRLYKVASKVAPRRPAEVEMAARSDWRVAASDRL